MTHSFPTRRSSDLRGRLARRAAAGAADARCRAGADRPRRTLALPLAAAVALGGAAADPARRALAADLRAAAPAGERRRPPGRRARRRGVVMGRAVRGRAALGRSEEHTSELQSLMRISYAVFCLKKKTN